MNKKIKIGLITLALFVFSAVSITACMAVLPKKNVLPSDYDMGVTYEQAMKEEKPILAVFYVDWCTYCRHFMPKLDIVRKINKNKINVVLLNVEDEKNEAVSKEYRIAAFPTVYIIDPKYDFRFHIDSGFLENVSVLNKEIDKFLKYRELIEKKSCNQ